MIGVRAALWLLTLGVRLLGHWIGRRLLAALLLISVCAGVVIVVFTSPEPVEPEPNARPAATGPDQRAKPPATASTSLSSQGAASPEQAAAAWYARHKQLPRSRVRVLQHDQVNTRLVRVLVLADSGGGRLDTAVVTVRRTDAGWQAGP